MILLAEIFAPRNQAEFVLSVFACIAMAILIVTIGCAIHDLIKSIRDRMDENALKKSDPNKKDDDNNDNPSNND